jgi:hypothetical protein
VSPSIRLVSRGDYFEIFGCDAGGAIGGFVAAHRNPPGRAEALPVRPRETGERSDSRSIIEPVKLDRFGNRERECQLSHHSPDLDIGRMMAEALANIGLVARSRGLGTLAAGETCAGNPEQLADKAGRRPVGHRDVPAGPADPSQLACGDIRAAAQTWRRTY